MDFASGNGIGSSTGSPCGACKFLRRKCAPDCIFAPYFCPEEGAHRIAAIHKVFGASNVSKLLMHIPAHDRCEAVVTIAYEAQARIRDPVYGCVSNIFALQQQVACLQTQLLQAKAELAHQNQIENEWSGNASLLATLNQFGPTSMMNPLSPLSSFESSIDHRRTSDGKSMQDIQNREDSSFQAWAKKISYNNDSGELQDLAHRMMQRNYY
ncbi:unnamed protein product [Lupinus luteus]|uniref:LOB domain-containing protein n=1 Tax=Lupinus luteus TaxID=3873 RepID=A0AAV1VUE3_LUPLU